MVILASQEARGSHVITSALLIRLSNKCVRFIRFHSCGG